MPCMAELKSTYFGVDSDMLTESFLPHSDIYHEPFKCSSCEEEDGKRSVHSQSLPPCHLSLQEFKIFFFP